MKTSSLIIGGLALTFILASLWGCAKEEDRPQEQSDRASEASSQSLVKDKRIIESQETMPQASPPTTPPTTEQEVGNTDENLPEQAILAQQNTDPPQERESLSGPWVCTLTLGPIGASPAAARLLLLPDPNNWTDADAYPLYEKAIGGLGPDVPVQRLADWLRIDGPGFPVEEAIETLALFDFPLAQLELASKCSQCAWPKVKVGAMVPHLTELRHLIFLVALKARIQIEQRRFAEAGASLQVGMVLAYHLGQAPLVIQGMVASAMESVLGRQMGQQNGASGTIGIPCCRGF